MGDAILDHPRVTWARRVANLLVRVQSNSMGASLVTGLRQAPLLGATLRSAIGFRGAFSTPAEAEAAAAGVVSLDQDVAANATLHLRLAQTPRPSDAPAMGYLRPLVTLESSLFDLGGNIGNLFYLYAGGMEIPAGFRWMVHDLPAIMQQGAALARERGETRLQFASDISAIAQAPILLASGALHYWPAPLPQMLQRWNARPRHVLMNRTPLINGPETHVIQDAGNFFARCTLYPRAAVFDGMRALGYRLIEAWDAPDLCLHIPAWPERSVKAYSGAYWVLE
jgi:putative methyltransferase (TIGR04325 family)